MTDDRSTDGRELSRAAPALPPVDPPDRPSRSAPPPRPPISSPGPPPIAPITRPPRLLRAARAAWGLSALTGTVALVVVALRRTDQFTRLRSMIEDLELGYDSDTIDTAATIAFWGTFGALAVLLLVELLLRGPAERRALARWGLLAVVVVHAAISAATISLIALGSEGLSTRLLVLAQLILAGLALVLTAVSASLNRRRPPTPPPAGAERRR